MLVCSLSILADLSHADGVDYPNFVLIVTDDQGWWDLTSHGNTNLDTPNMDRIGHEGAELTRFYVAPVCAPTRAGLMTGRYAFRTGLYNTRFGGDTMAADEITIAEILKTKGYRTGVFGKWHLGKYAPNSPNAQGFDEALTFWHGHIERYDHPSQLTHNGRPVQARGYITDLLTDAAIGFMTTTPRDQPFFCYLPYNVPHEPFVVGHAVHQQHEGRRLIEKYTKRGLPVREARLYAMIDRCDQNIGRLLDAIDDLELADSTIVFFMSDNGGIHSIYRAGLKGRKGSVYEGGVRSPFFARWPGKFPAGVRFDAMASHVDLLPTICEMVGVSPPDDRKIDGKSLLGLLTTGKGDSPHEYVYHNWNRYVPLVDKKWAIGGQRWKLANGQLFDLQTDPGERKNFAKKHPERVEQMRGDFVRWFEDVTAGQDYRPIAIPVGRDDQNPVEIQASWATLHGESTNYTFLGYDWDTIDGWNQPGDKATWRIDVVNPGRYEVTISYGAASASAGSRLRIAADEASLEYTVQPTVTPNVFVRHRLGEVTLAGGEQTLRAEVVSIKGPELMRLNRIWLRRIPDG